MNLSDQTVYGAFDLPTPPPPINAPRQERVKTRSCSNALLNAQLFETATDLGIFYDPEKEGEEGEEGIDVDELIDCTTLAVRWLVGGG